MSQVIILPETTQKPITLIGKMAGVAYHSNTSDDEKNYKRGINCIKSGHHRTLEFPDVYLTLDGYTIKTMREFMRHVGDGLSLIQDSTRYVSYDEDNFKFVTPPAIKNNEKANQLYDAEMKSILQTYEELLVLGIAAEDASLVIPLGLETIVTGKKNARNLAEMSQVRMCTRAYHEYRKLMKDLINALSEYSEEWAELCSMLFKPKCEIYGYCTEEYSCGKYPRKEM
jgi:thymidylate synthase (FAD)